MEIFSDFFYAVKNVFDGLSFQKYSRIIYIFFCLFHKVLNFRKWYMYIKCGPGNDLFVALFQTCILKGYKKNYPLGNMYVH